MPTTTSASATFRPFEFGVTRARHHQHGGNTYLQADQPLAAYPHRMTDRLVHWASATPERTLYARRDPALGGEWRHLSFAQALEGAATLFGESPALRVLQVGESHGISQYENALASEDVSAEAKVLIRKLLLPNLASHLTELQQRRDRAE